MGWLSLPRAMLAAPSLGCLLSAASPATAKWLRRAKGFPVPLLGLARMRNKLLMDEIWGAGFTPG